MNRFGIFSVYDRDGILDPNTLDTIQNLKTCLSYLVVVVNGFLQDSDMEILRKNSNQVIIRSNSGFDSGAYKDVLFHHTDSAALKAYDEFVFCNDTFYGPFCSFGQIFSEMSGRHLDFWGLSYIDSKLLKHMQSYFYCFTAPVFWDSVFPYFEKHIDERTSSLSEVYARFEQGLFLYLKQHGYTYGAYGICSPLRIYKNPYEILTESKLPLLKKKCFDPKECVRDNLLAALRYIQKTYHYNLLPILESARRRYGFSASLEEILCAPLTSWRRIAADEGVLATPESVEAFLRQHRSVYIYGAGIWGSIIYAVFVEATGKMQGFLCSDKAHLPASGRVLGLPVYPLCDFHSDADTGVIVALGAENTHQVKPLLGESPAVFYLFD